MTVKEEQLKRIESLVPNENVRNIIFGYDNHYDDFLTDQNMINYFHNTLVFTSLLVYSAFLSWKSRFDAEVTKSKEGRVGKFSNSMIRLYNLLEGCYDIKKFDLDYIENLIVNLQIDSMLVTTSDSFVRALQLENFFNFKDSKITKYLYLLKKSRLSSRNKTEFMFDKLCEVFEMFPYLRHIKVDFVPYSDDESSDLYSSIVRYDNTREFDIGKLLIVNSNRCYLLDDFSINDVRKMTDDNPDKDQTVILHYLAFCEQYEIDVVLRNSNATDKYAINTDGNNKPYCFVGDSIVEDFLLSYNIINCDYIQTDSYFFKDYISFNNKYIKYLSLVISDVISFQTKANILKEYREKYNEVFQKMHIRTFYDNDNAHYYRWDEIVMFLLLEEGIFDFLEFVLRYENYESFLYAFRFRLGEDIQKIIQGNIIIEKPTYNLSFKNGDAIRRSQANALILLATKLLTVGDSNFWGDFSSPQLSDIISQCEQIAKSTVHNVYDKIEYYVNSVISTVTFLEAFYSELIKYSCEMTTMELSLKETWFPSYDEYENEKNALIKKFSTAVGQKKRENLIKLNIHNLRVSSNSFFADAEDSIERAFKMLLDINATAKRRNKIENEALFEATGKREIFDSGEINKYLDFIKNDIIKCGESKDKNVAFDALQKDVNNFYDYLGRGGSKDSVLEMSIYPLVGTYSHGVVSRDGYRYSYMMITPYKSEKPIKIKMIVDGRFDFGQAYYCVPNLNRIANIKKKTNGPNERIWISPIIVPHRYSLYDSEAHITRLRDDDEDKLIQAAELLYHTDDSIYGRLFGSIDNAKKIMPQLFKNPRSVFYKDYYYVVEYHNEIVAIASVYSKLPEWDSSIIDKAFMENNIEIPKTTREAYSYFVDTFNDVTGACHIICDLCVKSEYRNKGLARLLLASIIQKAGEAGCHVIISVYSDNVAAHSLYSSVGFVSYLLDYDTRGTSVCNQKYYKMIKYT